MTKNTQKWRPDTCGCELHTEELQDGSRVPIEEYSALGVVQKTKRCPIHQVVDLTSLHDAILTENTGKNKVVKKVVEFIGKENIKAQEVKWSFDENRKLKIEVPLGVVVDRVALQKELRKEDKDIIVI